MTMSPIAGAGVLSTRPLLRALALAVGALLGTLPASAMSYRLVDAEVPGCGASCPKVIYASGTIRHDEYLSFMAFVQEVGVSRISSLLIVDSPGGFNSGAAGLGMLVRKLKMSVVVGQPAGGAITRSSGLTSATCASACVLVLAGGTTRHFVEGSRVGVHRAHMGPEVRDPSTRAIVSGNVSHADVKSAYARYFRRMGVDQGLATVMDQTPSGDMRWLTPAELGRFRLARNAAARR